MLLVLAFSSTTLWYVQKDEALPGPGTAYVVNNAPPTTQAAFAPNTVYVGTIEITLGKRENVWRYGGKQGRRSVHYMHSCVK
jgi:hypothetical protein